MEINMMSWNTELYIYGTRNEDGILMGRIEEAPVDGVKQTILNYMSLNQNPIVVLQEIPFKRKKEDGKWEVNPHYKALRSFFEENNYEIFCLDSENEWHIKMTMVISERNLLTESSSIKKSNIFVPVIINEKNVNILGVHAHNALDLIKWKNNTLYTPNIIIGDFNAGNYIKSEKVKDEKIKKNRDNYQRLSTGYIDACQGKYTTRYKEPTQVDHILIENSFQFNNRYKLINARVDTKITYSDHYPIDCKLEIK